MRGNDTTGTSTIGRDQLQRLKWRIGKDEHHRDFELDGSRTIVDVGALPGVAPPR